MNTIELFSGTKSFSKVAARLGHRTFTIDSDPSLEPDLCVDILTLNTHNINKFINEKCDILWASPPCQVFSIASRLSDNWKNSKRISKLKSISPKANHGIQLLDKTIELISILKPEEWFIENPRGMMRKVIDDIFKKYKITGYRRITVTYCQYGDKRMKPTDIWTNNYSWVNRPKCNNKGGCHERSPRGSHKTGTQGLQDAKERGIIPEELFIEIFKHKALNNLLNVLGKYP